MAYFPETSWFSHCGNHLPLHASVSNSKNWSYGNLKNVGTFFENDLKEQGLKYRKETTMILVAGPSVVDYCHSNIQGQLFRRHFLL
jgi:hypothetical protein